MTKAPLVKIEVQTAADVCVRFLVPPQGRALLQKDMSPGTFLEALVSNKQFACGIDFLAHALAAREAVWWGCLCFQHTCGDRMSATDKGAVTAAVQWVLQPGDNARSVAKAHADTAGPASVAGALALAAYQAGPSLSPGQRSEPASAFAWAKSVANAIKLACTKGDPAQTVKTQESFVKLGIGVAEGRFM